MTGRIDWQITRCEKIILTKLPTDISYCGTYYTVRILRSSYVCTNPGNVERRMHRPHFLSISNCANLPLFVLLSLRYDNSALLLRLLRVLLKVCLEKLIQSPEMAALYANDVMSRYAGYRSYCCLELNEDHLSDSS